MKTLKSILKKTILPMAVSSTIFFGGCGKREKGDSKGIGKFAELKNKGETEYIQNHERVVFSLEKIQAKYGWYADTLGYDLDNKKTYKISSLIRENQGDMHEIGSKKNISITLGGDEDGAYVKGVPYYSIDEYHLAEFNENYIQYDEKGNFNAKKLVEKLQHYTTRDHLRGNQEKIIFTKTPLNNYFLVKKAFWKSEPFTIELDIYQLKKEKIPEYNPK